MSCRLGRVRQRANRAHTVVDLVRSFWTSLATCCFTPSRFDRHHLCAYGKDLLSCCFLANEFKTSSIIALFRTMSGGARPTPPSYRKLLAFSSAASRHPSRGYTP
ncbi:unnamed protein product [Cylicostephanus goldi]|uniref:Uncharacterized protein n=1 Tax=Cylicostephanus goldi TaxID=71465 RepID=A0A3P7N1F0_CYLGO|nr:unnamed protein product [Cylicostephanus goldi]